MEINSNNNGFKSSELITINSNKLPNEIWDYIFNFINDIDTKVNLLQTCKLFRIIINKLYFNGNGRIITLLYNFNKKIINNFIENFLKQNILYKIIKYYNIDIIKDDIYNEFFNSNNLELTTEALTKNNIKKLIDYYFQDEGFVYNDMQNFYNKLKQINIYKKLDNNENEDKNIINNFKIFISGYHRDVLDNSFLDNFSRIIGVNKMIIKPNEDLQEVFYKNHNKVYYNYLISYIIQELVFKIIKYPYQKLIYENDGIFNFSQERDDWYNIHNYIFDLIDNFMFKIMILIWQS